MFSEFPHERARGGPVHGAGVWAAVCTACPYAEEEAEEEESGVFSSFMDEVKSKMLV